MFDKLKAVFADNRGQTGGMDLPSVMIVLVIAGVVGFVGLQVMSTVISTTSIENGAPLSNASDSLVGAVNDAWGLVGVAFIVIILAVIIVYLYGLRSGGR
jgi:Na+/proline symporter